MTLDEITAELVAAHEAGHDVARLCSGDPSVFSAVAEQTRRLDAAGVPWEIVPGVPAFAAAAAALRTELTVPGVGQSVVLTRDAANATPMPPGESLDVWAAAGGTLVLHLAVQRCASVVEALLRHRPASEPVAVVAPRVPRRRGGPARHARRHRREGRRGGRPPDRGDRGGGGGRDLRRRRVAPLLGHPRAPVRRPGSARRAPSAG